MASPTDNRPWRPFLVGAEAIAALQVVGQVALQLTNPANFAKLEEQALEARRLSSPEFRPWLHRVPHGLAQGHSGVAIFFGQLDRCVPDEGWDQVAHDHLRSAVEDVRGSGLPQIGLFGGLAGVTFAARYLSRQRRRYCNLLERLEGALNERAIANLSIRVGDLESIDLVSGSVGLLIGLPSRAEFSRARTMLLDTIAATLEKAHPAVAPVDCGVAHGIAGGLALLASERLAGGPALYDAAIISAVALLQRLARKDQWGDVWPTVINPGTESDFVPVSPPTWCYGSAGIATALWQAGRALDDQSLQISAVDALMAAHSRLPTTTGLGAGFCHGLAGLAQVTMRIAHQGGHVELMAAATRLLRLLLQMWGADRTTGWYDLAEDGTPIDDPGLLNGAVGAALTLLAGCSEVKPNWDRIFLLSQGTA